MTNRGEPGTRKRPMPPVSGMTGTFCLRELLSAMQGTSPPMGMPPAQSAGIKINAHRQRIDGDRRRRAHT
jgi:hypothetical protein